MTTKYVVVEYSGQDRAREVATFGTWQEAYAFVKKTYAVNELDRGAPEYMDVGIRADFADGESEYQS